MKRMWIRGAWIVTAVALAIAMTTTAHAQPDRARDEAYAPKLVPVGPGGGHGGGHGLRVRVWTDRGEGAQLTPGTPVRVHFRASRDAFVTVYNVEANGRVNVLFPVRGDGFVRGGRAVELPRRGRLVVGGPIGVERLVAVATPRPHHPRDFWPGGHDRGGRGNGGWNVGARIEVRAGSGYAPKALVHVGGRGRGPRVARDETWFRVVARRGGWCPW